MEYSEIITNRIRSICKQRHISIYKLSAMSGVKQSTLNNIMWHTKNPGIKSLHQIANAFNMTLAEFLDFDELNNYSFDDEDDEEES